MKNQKIVRLQAENVKRLKAVEIEPSGNVVVIGGKNAQGKTSVLDSIEMLFGGTRSTPDEPIRRGESTAKIIGETEDLIVTRKFTNGKVSKIEVKGKSGAVMGSPQKILSSLCGSLAFDPLAFQRMKPKERLETLKQALKIDFSKLDDDRRLAFDERTEVKRMVRNLESRIESKRFHRGLPEKEVSIADLVSELDRRKDINRRNEQKRDELGRVRQVALELREKIQAMQKEFEHQNKVGRRLRVEVDALVDEDAAGLQDEIMTAEDKNQRIRENNERGALGSELNRGAAMIEELTRSIEKIDEIKSRTIEEADIPVAGLNFDDDEVTLNGLPFDQASSAEQLKASLAIGIAINPTLRVILIRDGSLLDENSMAEIAAMAQKSNCQIWIERVGDGDEASVIIEDGMVTD